MNLDALMQTKKVDSRNQLKNSSSVRFENLQGDGMKVLFVGNSVTLHGPSEEVGWDGDWGMAASEEAKDYVHLVEKFVCQKHENASFCIVNAADWEREYRDFDDKYQMYDQAREFDADIIICKLSANTEIEDYEEDLYLENFGKLLDYLNKSKKAKLLITTEFLHHPAEAAIRRYCAIHSLPLCELSDIADHDEYKALGLFKHPGVEGHPGDSGMNVIAERICNLLKDII